jgi:hypothetical protein
VSTFSLYSKWLRTLFSVPSLQNGINEQSYDDAFFNFGAGLLLLICVWAMSRGYSTFGTPSFVHRPCSS